MASSHRPPDDSWKPSALSAHLSPAGQSTRPHLPLFHLLQMDMNLAVLCPEKRRTHIPPCGLVSPEVSLITRASRETGSCVSPIIQKLSFDLTGPAVSSCGLSYARRGISGTVEWRHRLGYRQPGHVGAHIEERRVALEPQLQVLVGDHALNHRGLDPAHKARGAHLSVIMAPSAAKWPVPYLTSRRRLTLVAARRICPHLRASAPIRKSSDLRANRGGSDGF
jgi:hypothetical protein